jgi:hypothetical protein
MKMAYGMKDKGTALGLHCTHKMRDYKLLMKHVIIIKVITILQDYISYRRL